MYMLHKNMLFIVALIFLVNWPNNVSPVHTLLFCLQVTVHQHKNIAVDAKVDPHRDSKRSMNHQGFYHIF